VDLSGIVPLLHAGGGEVFKFNDSEMLIERMLKIPCGGGLVENMCAVGCFS
jgi:hypothetical protein